MPLVRARREVAGWWRCACSVATTGGSTMKTLFALLAWCVLFVLCWPLALLVLVLWPLAWLLLLPFRLVGITFSALFAFLHAVLMLPARLLGWKPAAPAT